jgi:hypothetical protein
MSAWDRLLAVDTEGHTNSVEQLATSLGAGITAGDVVRLFAVNLSAKSSIVVDGLLLGLGVSRIAHQ